MLSDSVSGRGGDNERHSDVIAGERMCFGLRYYWRRRPSRGEMSPSSNRTGFSRCRNDGARAQVSRQSNGSRLRDWSARRAILIGTLRRAYHVVLQRNNGDPDLHWITVISSSVVFPESLGWWRDRKLSAVARTPRSQCGWRAWTAEMPMSVRRQPCCLSHCF